MSLADVNEPLVLADGTKIDPSTGERVKEKKQRKFVEVPSASESQAIVARTRRTLADLPVPAGQMNALSLVLTYTLYGLATQEIAVAAGLTMEQVKNIRQLEQYRKLEQDIMESVLAVETNNVRNLFQQRAIDAANKIIDIAEDDEGALGFAAAKDILDRAGHRPNDVVEHRHTMENSLRIEYIKNEPVDVPTINADYKVIDASS